MSLQFRECAFTIQDLKLFIETHGLSKCASSCSFEPKLSWLQCTSTARAEKYVPACEDANLLLQQRHPLALELDHAALRGEARLDRVHLPGADALSWDAPARRAASLVLHFSRSSFSSSFFFLESAAARRCGLLFRSVFPRSWAARTFSAFSGENMATSESFSCWSRSAFASASAIRRDELVRSRASAFFFSITFPPFANQSHFLCVF